MTKHEYYELLCTCAVDGTFPSMDRGGCSYRGEESGTKCAIGIILPDELYDDKYEGISVAALPDKVLAQITPEGMTTEDLCLVQGVHDHLADFGEEWDSNAFLKGLNELNCFREFVA